MADRSSPSSGYDFGAKRQYRRQLYAGVRRSLHGHMADRTCVIMPSIEGDEIEVAMSYGFKQKNIGVIDRNPAIVATLKRRFPLIRTYGVDAATAAGRVARDFGCVDFVNLDLCGPVGAPTRDVLDAWRASGAIGEGRFVAVTMLRGRERDGLLKRLPAGHAVTCGADRPGWSDGTDGKRVQWVSWVLSGLPLSGASTTWDEWCQASHTAFTVDRGVYRSTAGHQTMLWAVFKMHSKACVCDECMLAFRHLIPDGVPFHKALMLKVRLLTKSGLYTIDQIVSASVGEGFRSPPRRSPPRQILEWASSHAEPASA